MPIKVVTPDRLGSPQQALVTINQINFLLLPGDPSPQGQAQQRSWQKCLTLGLTTLQAAQQRIEDKQDPDQLARVIFADAEGGKWSWRYLIGFNSGDALYASFDTQLKVTALSRGPRAAVTVQAARKLRSLPETAGGDYDVKVLAIPGLLTEVFWLSREGGDGPDDLIVPFYTSQDLRCGYPYPAGTFLRIVAALAKQRLSEKPTEIVDPGDAKPLVAPRAPTIIEAAVPAPNRENGGGREQSWQELAEAQVMHEWKERVRAVERQMLAEKRAALKEAQQASARRQGWNLVRTSKVV